MALNKIYSVYVIAGAAVAIVMSFVGKVSALLQSIPSPVLGGISIALFGVICFERSQDSDRSTDPTLTTKEIS